MSEATKEQLADNEYALWRDAERARVEQDLATLPPVKVCEVPVERLLRLLDDADRRAKLERQCAELEAEGEQRITELERRCAEFEDLAVKNAVTRDFETHKIEVQGRQIEELLADRQRSRSSDRCRHPQPTTIAPGLVDWCGHCGAIRLGGVWSMPGRSKR